MKKKFVRQARLPRAAYNKDLDEVLEPFRKREYEINKKKKRDKTLP